MPMSMKRGVAAGETAVAPDEKWAVLACVMTGAHSTEPEGRFMHRFTHAMRARRVPALALTLALALAGHAAPSFAAAPEWPDVEGRIQYGFYTEDARAVSDVVNQLSGPGGAEDPLRHYYIG